MQMIIHKYAKFELDPSNIQCTNMMRCVGMARFAYNWALNKVTNKIFKPNAMELNREWNKWKHNNISWHVEVAACVPEAAFHNLEQAFKLFFKKQSKFPKFKSKHRSKPSCKLRGAIKLSNNHIQLPRLGKIKLKHYYIITGDILSATISKRANRWFISLQIRQKVIIPTNNGPEIGIDLGIKNLATLSNGEIITGPKALQSKLEFLKILSKKFSRSQKGSKRRQKLKNRLSQLHYKISCIRQDHLHKLTAKLAKNYSHIGIEDLKVKNMVKNRSLARSISDMGWGEFRRQLEYKCNWYGSKLKIHNQFFASSKTCSNCQQKKQELSLSERVFSCKHCGFEIDRDINAAINLCPGVPRRQDDEAKSAESEGQSTSDLRLADETSTEHNTMW